MVEFFAEQNVFLYALAVIGGLGVVSQVLLFALYGRLLGDMDNTMTPKGKLMRQLRQKFSGYQRMNEGITNVSVFVKKSLMEFQFLGLNLHQWRRMGVIAFVLCLVIGLGGYYLTGLYDYAEDIRRNYLWATAASGLLLAGVYGITDIEYKQKYLQTGLENLLCNMMVSKSHQKINQEQEPSQLSKNKDDSARIRAQTAKSSSAALPTESVTEARGNKGVFSKRKRAKSAETQAQKDKRELKENLAKLKEGISETAAADDRERNSEILRNMDSEEQERIIREVLKEFLS